MIPLAFLRRYWTIFAVVGVVGLTLLLVRCIDRAQDRAVIVSHDAGRATQRADDLTESVNRVEKANAAAEIVRRDPVANAAGCMRHSRTPENCQ